MAGVGATGAGLAAGGLAIGAGAVEIAGLGALLDGRALEGTGAALIARGWGGVGLAGLGLLAEGLAVGVVLAVGDWLPRWSKVGLGHQLGCGVGVVPSGVLGVAEGQSVTVGLGALLVGVAVGAAVTVTVGSGPTLAVGTGSPGPSFGLG